MDILVLPSNPTAALTVDEFALLEGELGRLSLLVKLYNLVSAGLNQGPSQDVDELFRQADELSQRIDTGVTDSAVALNELSCCLDRIAEFTQLTGRLDEAADLYLQSIELKRRILPRVHDSTSTLRDLGASVGRLSEVFFARGRSVEAQDLLRQRIGLLKRMQADVGDKLEVLRDLSDSVNRLAEVLSKEGRVEDAGLLFQEAVELRRRALAIEGDTPDALRSLCISVDGLLGIAMTRFSAGEEEHKQALLNDARRLWQQKITLGRKILAAVGESSRELEQLTVDLYFLAQTYQCEDSNKAYDLCEQACQVGQRLRDVVGDNSDIVSGTTFDGAALLLCNCLDLQASIALEQQHLSEAESHYRKAYALRQRVTLMSDSPLALRSSAFDLDRLAGIAAFQGRRDDQYQRLQLSADLKRRVLTLEGDTIEALSELGATLCDLANVAIAVGQIDKAESLSNEALSLRERVLTSTGDTFVALTDVCLSFLQCAQLAKFRGRFNETRGFLVNAKESCERISHEASESPGSRYLLAMVLDALADISLSQGSLDEATSARVRAIALIESLHAELGDKPAVLRHLGLCYVGLGKTAFFQGISVDGEGFYKQAIEVFRGVHAAAGDSDQALADLAGALVETAHIALGLGRLAEARNQLLEASNLNRRVHTSSRDALWWVRIRLLILLGQAQLAFDQQRPQEGTTYLRQVLAQLEALPVFVQSFGLLAGSCLLTCLSVQSRCMPSGEAFDWRRRVHQGVVNFVDLQPPDVLETVRPLLFLWHRFWLLLALEIAPLEVPSVLSDLQGCKIAALVIDDLKTEAAQASFGASVIERLRSLRQELRRQAIGLQAAAESGAGVIWSDIFKGLLPRKPRVAPKHRVQQVFDFESNLKEYQQLRAEVSKEQQFTVLAPRMQIGSATLLASLAEGHGLLLLVQTPALELEDVQDLPNNAHGLLLTRETHPLLPLPQLASLLAHLRATSAAGNGVPGLRYSGEPGAQTSPPADLDASPAQALWTPLQPHLQGLHTLHVVTHGELHVLPLSLGAPEGLRIYQYPGLVFYWLQHIAPQRAAIPQLAATALALQVHSPAAGGQHPPIPFVHAEAQMVQGLWPPGPSPLRLDQELPVAVVHLAGHGQAGEEQDACLILGTEQRLGLHELLRSRLRPEIVYLSACLVGRTSEDLDGDPLGMVSGFFLRGARCVVAPLVPINDFYSPLLAVLFHHALRAQQEQGHPLDAHAALAVAKAQLQSGHWPEPVEQLIRDAYRLVLVPQIKQILKGTGWDPRNELPRQLARWLQPPCQPNPLWVLSHERIETIRASQGVEAAARLGADAVIELLLDVREKLHEHPGVQDLLRYMNVYGAPAKRR